MSNEGQPTLNELKEDIVEGVSNETEPEDDLPF